MRKSRVDWGRNPDPACLCLDFAAINGKVKQDGAVTTPGCSTAGTCTAITNNGPLLFKAVRQELLYSRAQQSCCEPVVELEGCDA